MSSLSDHFMTISTSGSISRVKIDPPVKSKIPVHNEYRVYKYLFDVSF